MSPRAFLILAVVTVLAVLGAVWALVDQQLSATEIRPAETPLFPQIAADADQVNKVTIKTRYYDVTLQHQGDSWVATQMGDYPAKTEPVAQLISGLASLRAYEPKTDNPDWYGQIDVGDPTTEEKSNGALVTAVSASGETLARVIIGKRSQSIGFNPLGGTFIRNPDNQQAWLAEGSVFVPNFLPDWFEGIVHVPGPDVRRITILEGEQIVFDTEKVDVTTGDYGLKSVDAKYGAPDSEANDNAIKSLAQGVVSTTFENARPRSDMTFAPDARTVRFVTADGVQIDVKLGQIDGETWVAYDVTGPDSGDGATKAAQIKERTANWAFKLPSYRVASLEKPVTDLIQAPEKPEEQPGAQAPAPGFLTPRPLIPALPGQ